MQLNEFQKMVVDKFNSSTKNLVITAPTGVGKTFVAQYLSVVYPGKVLYAVPLKALAYEIVDVLKGKFGVSALPLLSEAYEEDPEEVPEKVVVTTYEKGDGVTRRGYNWRYDIKLLIVDEVHNLDQKERSRAIENLVIWARDAGVRVVAMSATVPWVDKVKEWLDAEVLVYDKRPVPLFKYVRVGNTLYGVDGDTVNVKGDLLRKLMNRGKVVMVFSNTKKRAESLYLMYKRLYGDKVAFIHAGLEPDQRRQVIADTLKGKYNLIVSTTVLGQGVNLPFYAVVFDDVRLPVIEEGRFVGWRNLSSIEFDQICGRAGRPGFDEEGLCVIDAENVYQAREFVKRYLQPVTPKLDVEYPLIDLVLVVVARLVYAEVERIYRDVRYSFSHKDVSLEEVRDVLARLEDYDFVHHDTGFGNDAYSITGKGVAVAYSYIDVDTASYYISGLNRDIDFQDLVFRNKKVLEASKGKDVEAVVQAWLSGMDERAIVKGLDNFSVNDLNRLVSTIAWQTFALYRLAKTLDYVDAKKILYFHLQLREGVPIGALPLVQLPGIGRKRALALYGQGIHNKTELCSSRDVAEKIIGQKAVDYLCR